MKLFQKNSKPIEEREPLNGNFTYYSNFSERSPLLPRPQFNDSDADSDISDKQTTQTPSSSPVLEPDTSYQNESRRLRPEVVQYVRDSYYGRIENFKKYIKITIRRLKMLHDLHKLQNIVNRYEENYPDAVQSKLELLERLKSSVERRNAAGKSYFLLLFHLERFLTVTPSSLLISNSEISLTLCEILDSWLMNSCFFEKNFDRLKVFLKAYFRDGALLKTPGQTVPSLTSVYESWKTSLFYTERRQELINERQDFSNAFYFNVLKERLEADIEEAAFPMESLIEFGRSDIRKFHDFLTKHNIPFSGPFRRESNEPKLVYFLSSFNPSDAVVNNYSPIYGCFEFGLNSLKLGQTDAQDFFETLEINPYWLEYIPPAFNLDLIALRDQINRFP